jgi:dolichol-phosphate mannosyltransferase
MITAAIIPCFRVRNHVVAVVTGVLDLVDNVYIIDDCCPENSGQAVLDVFKDPKIKVVRHEVNQGVGGAMVTGYRLALADACEIMIKVDGDGQMDPRFIPALIRPIVEGAADYTKGNRFFSIDHLRGMPRLRLFGNAILSFVNKASSGYWNIMDPTNGFTAIHAAVLGWIPLSKISQRYFFESDMLFRLGVVRAVIMDVPMRSLYGDEISNMKIGRVAVDFPQRYLANFCKRFFYNYVLRDLNVGTIETVMGTMLLLFGSMFGLAKWYEAAAADRSAPVGTIMLSAMTITLGVQFLLAALSFDVGNVPTVPIQRKLMQSPDRLDLPA